MLAATASSGAGDTVVPIWQSAAMIDDVLIIGAGVAGLACARVAAAAGRKVRVIERARGVGGRCATRRIEDQPVDHGLVFIHGRSPEFRAALSEVPGPWRDGWPMVIQGSGTPCQPSAFAAGSYRLAHAHGNSALAKHWAQGLDVALETRAVGMELRNEGIAVLAIQRDAQVTFIARDVVLAMAGPQSLNLLANPTLPPKVETARALLSMMPSVPCATVIALYPADAPRPAWDVLYPESSSALLLLSHDSAKREAPTQLALVLQARPAWSKDCLGLCPDTWAPRLLDEAARLLGPWAAKPTTLQGHMWRHARVNADCELSAPLLIDLGRRCRLGVVGELFDQGGGVQAAWQSGRQLAHKLLEEAR
jgi:predicted NAD/FAD-dependent oxidoreductase